MEQEGKIRTVPNKTKRVLMESSSSNSETLLILDSDNELSEDEPLSPIKFGLQRSPLKEKCYLLSD